MSAIIRMIRKSNLATMFMKIENMNLGFSIWDFGRASFLLTAKQSCTLELFLKCAEF